MEIKVFGSNCGCTTTEDLVQEVVAAKGGNITVKKITDLKELMVAGIMSTPAVTIDGVIKSTGKVPTKDEIAAWIDGAASAASTPAASACGCGKPC